MAESPQIIDMLDTIGANAGAIPAGTRRVATYVTGSGGIAWSSGDIAKLRQDDPQLQLLMRIDQSNSVLSFPFYVVKDVEPGASTNATAVDEAKARRDRGLRTCLYTYIANFAALRQMVDSAGVADHVDYWIADWSLDREQAIAFIDSNPAIKAVQYASPTSNPNTLVPGGHRTLAEANIDISVTRADWPAPLPAGPAPKPARPKRHVPRPHPVHVVKKVAAKVPVHKLHPKVQAAGLAGVLAGAVVAYLNSHGVAITHLTGPEQEAVTLIAALLAAYVKGA